MGTGSRRLGVGAAVVDGALVPGDVIVADGVVAAIGASPAGADGRVAVPGFVDVQINGFAGVDFTHTDLDGYRAAARAIARTGTTAIVPTLPTAAPDRYARRSRWRGAAMAAPAPGARLLGLHLEGPFLSPLRAGAHNPAWLRIPDRDAVEAWLAMASVTMMTIAPELPGALELIAWLHARGVVVSLGHTDATKPVAHAGFDAGATMVTHLWNAQRQPTSREPAVGGVGLARGDVRVGVICDLVHVDADTLRLSFAAAGERFVAVTDAVAFAGMPDGTYSMGQRPVVKAAGAVRLADGTLAGSAGTMDVTLRNLVSLGVPLLAAVGSMTTAPRAAPGRARPVQRSDPCPRAGRRRRARRRVVRGHRPRRRATLSIDPSPVEADALHVDGHDADGTDAATTERDADAGRVGRLVIRVALVVVCVVGLVVRVWPRGALWLDEAQSVAIARLPLTQIVGALRQDGAPPLYYLLLHGWILVFGTGDVAVRSLTVVTSVAFVATIVVAARRLAVSGRHGACWCSPRRVPSRSATRARRGCTRW